MADHLPCPHLTTRSPVASRNLARGKGAKVCGQCASGWLPWHRSHRALESRLLSRWDLSRWAVRRRCLGVPWGEGKVAGLICPALSFPVKSKFSQEDFTSCTPGICHLCSPVSDTRYHALKPGGLGNRGPTAALCEDPTEPGLDGPSGIRKSLGAFRQTGIAAGLTSLESNRAFCPVAHLQDLGQVANFYSLTFQKLKTKMKLIPPASLESRCDRGSRGKAPCTRLHTPQVL